MKLGLGASLAGTKAPVAGRERDRPRHFVESAFYSDHIVPRSEIHRFVNRNIGEHSEKAACHHKFLTADAVGERAHHGEERHADEQRDCNYNVCGLHIHFQNGLHVKQGIELPGVPDHALSRGGSEERNENIP